MTTTSIPINSLSRHIAPLASALGEVAARVVSSGHFVLGPSVSSFEAAFATYCGTRHCAGVANGTDALEIGLRSLGVGPGDRVAVIANAAMYSTTAVVACGATPVFIDVIDQEWTMDPCSLSNAIEAGDIKAVIVTHLYGRLARMSEIIGICEQRGIPVMEDCAQAHGARDGQGRVAGSLGTVASFSFYPTKNLGGLGDGGAVTTNDPEIDAKVRALRQYGWTSKYTNAISGGRNSRLDEVQAAFLLEMLPLLDGWNDKRRNIANRYSNEIKNPRIDVPTVSGPEYVAHLYVVASEERERLRKHLASAGIQSDVHYPVPDHLQPCHEGKYASMSLPVTSRSADRVLTLPCFPELTDEEASAVIDACNTF